MRKKQITSTRKTTINRKLKVTTRSYQANTPLARLPQVEPSASRIWIAAIPLIQHIAQNTPYQQPNTIERSTDNQMPVKNNYITLRLCHAKKMTRANLEILTRTNNKKPKIRPTN